MGIKVKRETTKGDVTKTILTLVRASTVLAAALVAPNTLQCFEKLGIIPRKRQKDIINQARDNLIRSGHLKRDSEGFLRLTNKGETKLEDYQRSDYTILVPRIWDKKWRVLIFDIPEKKRSLRNKVRNTLISIGFLRVQDSVWIFPYDCEDLVALLKADFKIGKDLLYAIISKIENDLEFRDWFGLVV